MNKKNRWKKLAALTAVTGMLTSSFCVPAMAQTVDTTPVNGTTSTITKYLTMDQNANVPNKTFTFTIEPLTKAEADRANTNDASLSVRPGISGARIQTAVFVPGQATFPLSSPASDDAEAAVYVTAEEAALMKYAKSDVVIDFTGVEFTEPGVYRYKVTEDSANAEDGIYEIDENAVRYIDVYVASSDEGELSIQGYVLHTSNTAPQDKTSDAYDDFDTDYDPEDSDKDYKDQGFTNRYVTHDLILSKQVTGNQAYRGEYFCYTVVISGDTEGTVYSVDLTDADASGTIHVADTEERTTYLQEEDFTNPESLTVGSDGSVTAAFYLKHGQTIRIRGLKYTTDYSVTEDEKDYSASVTVDDGVNTAAVISGDATGERVINKADSTVSYTNERSGAVPTGIFLNYGVPVMCILGSLAILAFLMLRTRRRRLDEV